MTILPFIEQTSLYENVIRRDYGTWWPDTAALASAAATRLDAYICPTDSIQAKMTVASAPTASFDRYFWGVTSAFNQEYHATCYKSVLGAKWPTAPFYVTLTNNPATNFPSAGGRFSNHLGGDEGIDWGNGAFPSGRRCGRLSDFTFVFFESVTDGLSNTFGFGEGSVYWQGSAAWVDPQTIGASVGIPLNQYKLYRNDRKTFTDDNHWQESFGFSSEHPGGAQFAALDGTVRFVSETVDQYIYQAAGSIDAGEARSLP
jgi:hypothetical protein